MEATPVRLFECRRLCAVLTVSRVYFWPWCPVLSSSRWLSGHINIPTNNGLLKRNAIKETYPRRRRDTWRSARRILPVDDIVLTTKKENTKLCQASFSVLFPCLYFSEVTLEEIKYMGGVCGNPLRMAYLFPTSETRCRVMRTSICIGTSIFPTI